MERLNELIEEYIIDMFEKYREDIEYLYIYYDGYYDEADSTLFQWLFNGCDLGEAKDFGRDIDLIDLIDWLNINHNDFTENFLKDLSGLELIDIFEKMDNYYYELGADPILKELTNYNTHIEKTHCIIRKYAYSMYSCIEITRESIIKMIEERDATMIIPK